MRKKAAITSGVAAVVLSGGLALALNGGGTASAAPTAGTASSARPAAAPSVRPISRAEAEQIALAAVPGGRVRSAELESEHGVTVWSVRVVKGGMTHDLQIDARTGKVVRDRAGKGHDRQAQAQPRHDRVREVEHRHGEAEPGDDRGRESEQRHGADDAPGDDHGGHGSDDHGKDDGHRGHGG
jgi:hypothetical protein